MQNIFKVMGVAVVVAYAAWAAGVALAQEEQPAKPVPPAERAQPTLATDMKTIDEQFAKIRKLAFKPELVKDAAFRTAALAALQTIQLAAVRAKAQVPDLLTKVEDVPKRTAQVTAYRTRMCAFIRTLLELEEALLAQDEAKVKPLFKRLGDAKKRGHSSFKESQDW